MRVFLIEDALAMWNDPALYMFHKLFHKPLTHLGMMKLSKDVPTRKDTNENRGHLQLNP